MAIQNRHGTYPYFDQGKMVTGEFAIVTGGDPHTSTGKAVYICFAPGDCQRFATNEEISAAISDAIEQSGEFQDVVVTTVEGILAQHPEWTTTVEDGVITPAKISSDFITSLTANSTGDDTDLLVVGNHGTSTLRKFTFANLAAFIKEKIASLLRDGTIGSVTVDFNDITDGWHQIDASTAVANAPVTGRQTGIILQTSNTAGSGTKYQLYTASGGNELWQRTYWYGTWYAWHKIYGKSTASVSTGSYGMTAAKFVRHGNEVLVQFGGTPSGLTTGWKQAIQIPAGFIPTETRTPYATCVPQNGGFQPFLVTATSAGYIELNPTYTQVTGFVNALYTYYVD